MKEGRTVTDAKITLLGVQMYHFTFAFCGESLFVVVPLASDFRRLVPKSFAGFK